MHEITQYENLTYGRSEYKNEQDVLIDVCDCNKDTNCQTLCVQQVVGPQTDTGFPNLKVL